MRTAGAHGQGRGAGGAAGGDAGGADRRRGAAAWRCLLRRPSAAAGVFPSKAVRAAPRRACLVEGPALRRLRVGLGLILHPDYCSLAAVSQASCAGAGWRVLRRPSTAAEPVWCRWFKGCNMAACAEEAIFAHGRDAKICSSAAIASHGVGHMSPAVLAEDGGATWGLECTWLIGSCTRSSLGTPWRAVSGSALRAWHRQRHAFLAELMRGLWQGHWQCLRLLALLGEHWFTRR